MIKFVGLDLDGTLLDSSKRVSEKNAAAIRFMEENGIVVTFFTGRTWLAAEEYLTYISKDVACVFQNGAYIVKSKSGETLRRITLPVSESLKILEKAREKGFFSLLTTNFTTIPDMVYEGSLPISSHFSEYLRRNLYRMAQVDDVSTYMSEECSGIVWIGRLDEIKNALQEMELRAVSLVVDTVIEGEAFVEFFGQGCGKEKAMEFLLDYYGFQREEAAFFGDSYNDLKVIEMVHGVAMENAPDDVKRVAEFVTLPNDEDGLFHAVEKFILKENDPVD